ncbi:hypothetical protein [Streptosporangium sp. NPDC002607]
MRSAEARLRRDIAAGTVRTEPVRELVREALTHERTQRAAAEAALRGKGAAS